MSAFGHGPRQAPREGALREGLFPDALARWVAGASGSDAVAALARMVAAAEAQGHGAVPIDADGRSAALPDAPPVDLAALAGQAWVGDGSRPTPLVLDAARRAFSWRAWRAEADIAAALRARAAHRIALDEDAITADVDALFAGQDARASADQRRAVEAALRSRLFVLAGGPGTGKTTTVLRLLALAQRQHRALGFEAPPAVALAAPTGKAAARLAASLGEGLAALRESLDDSWTGTLDALPAEARTLHRLLRFDPRQDRFRRDASQPLAERIVVVDEASMIDLGLMRALLAALSPDALLVLVGDPGQLAPVAAGSVLADVVAAAPEGPADGSEAPPLAGRCLRLGHVFRARGALLDFAAALRRGAPEEAFELLRGPGAGEAPLRLLPTADAGTLRRRLREHLESRAADFDAMAGPGAQADLALAALARCQLLAALRGGAHGVVAINAAVDAWLRQRLGVAEDARWYPGRAVMVIRNEPTLGLFNGDTGIALADADGTLEVWFAGAEGRPRPLPPRLVPEHEDAFALTVHKSQGSEYERVVVVLPPEADSPILSRELVYTAATRARRGVEIWGSAEVLAAAMARPIVRHGSLRERLLARD